MMTSLSDCNSMRCSGLGKTSPSGKCGFTMMEMVIVIAVIAILAAVITPLAVNQVTQKRYETCREQLRTIKQAIVGDASLVEGGIRSSYGYVGDMGRLPNTLAELMIQSAQANYQASGLGWNWGWRGPYLGIAVDGANAPLDPWGNAFHYSFNLFNYSAVHIWSVGADGTDNTYAAGSDDVETSIRIDELYSQVSGNTLDGNFVQTNFLGTLTPTNQAIVLDYPDGAGVQHAALTYPPVQTIYQFTAIPIGIRSIRFKKAAGTAGTVSQLLIHINSGPMTTYNLVDSN